MSDYIFRMLWEVKKEEPSIFGVLIHDKLTVGSIKIMYVYIIIIPVSKKLSGKVFILGEKCYSINRKKSQRHIY